MSTRKLSNVSLAQYRDFLFKIGCKYIRTSDGHEVWTKKELTRPIIFQTHIEPIPEFILKNALRALGISKTQFREILEGK